MELLYNGVALDVLGIGYETFPDNLRAKAVAQYSRVNFKRDIAMAFLEGFEHKTKIIERRCNEDICSKLQAQQFLRSDSDFAVPILLRSRFSGLDFGRIG